MGQVQEGIKNLQAHANQGRWSSFDDEQLDRLAQELEYLQTANANPACLVDLPYAFSGFDGTAWHSESRWSDDDSDSHTDSAAFCTFDCTPQPAVDPDFERTSDFILTQAKPCNLPVVLEVDESIDMYAQAPIPEACQPVIDANSFAGCSASSLVAQEQPQEQASEPLSAAVEFAGRSLPAPQQSGIKHLLMSHDESPAVQCDDLELMNREYLLVSVPCADLKQAALVKDRLAELTCIAHGNAAASAMPLGVSESESQSERKERAILPRFPLQVQPANNRMYTTTPTREHKPDTCHIIAAVNAPHHQPQPPSLAISLRGAISQPTKAAITCYSLPISTQLGAYSRSYPPTCVEPAAPLSTSLASLPSSQSIIPARDSSLLPALSRSQTSASCGVTSTAPLFKVIALIVNKQKFWSVLYIAERSAGQSSIQQQLLPSVSAHPSHAERQPFKQLQRAFLLLRSALQPSHQQQLSDEPPKPAYLNGVLGTERAHCTKLGLNADHESSQQLQAVWPSLMKQSAGKAKPTTASLRPAHSPGIYGTKHAHCAKLGYDKAPAMKMKRCPLFILQPCGSCTISLYACVCSLAACIHISIWDTGWRCMICFAVR